MAAVGAGNSKRRELDIRKLMLSDYDVELVDDGSEFMVMFHGPQDTHYVGGLWKVHVTLPKDYPFRSPSIGFKNRLFHPNVDEGSGSVCLDVINQTWSPMYDLLNIFDIFLPQLLAYPNPSDPLNSQAASLLLQDPEEYKKKVEEHVRRHAPSNIKPIATATQASCDRDSSASSSSAESFGSMSSAGIGGGGDDANINNAVRQGDDVDDDDLSSLSDESDDEGDLVLDL